MNNELRELCDLFIENRDEFKKVFKFEGYMNEVTAMIYTERGYHVVENDIRNNLHLLKENAGIFSMLRSFLEELIVGKMSVASDPLLYIETIKTLSEMIDPSKVFKTEYALLSAITLVDNVEPERYREYINRIKSVYERIKDIHGIMTSGEDIFMASLLAISNIDEERLFLDAKENYKLVKGKIAFAPNHDISYIISLDLGAPGLKAEKYLQLYDELKQRRMKFSSEKTPALAVLSLLEIDNTEICNLIEEVNEYLEDHKGFGGLTMFKSTRLMHAGLLVAKYLEPENDLITALVQYVSLSAAISAARAATSAAV